MYKRSILSNIYKNISQPRKFIQTLIGPRQVGKTTIVQQLKQEIQIPSIYISADDSVLKDRIWLESSWAKARRTCVSSPKNEVLLIIDEVQKIKNWSEVIKSLWDQDTRNKINLKVILLGSSALHLTKGSSESLAGRFEITFINHWSFLEMKEAFNFDLEKYLFFGGYPGAAVLIDDEQRWKQYIQQSIIESVVNLDILSMTRIEKPSLLRQLFYLICEYSGQMLSYTKMLGQLQDAGNTTTLAHYLDLIATAGLAVGLQKWSSEKVHTRASSPKLNVMDLGLMNATGEYSSADLKTNTEFRGRIVESAVGAHLINSSKGKNIQIYYWNDGSKEVDFVVTKGKKILAIEVKSGKRSRHLNGLNFFLNKHPSATPLLIGAEGVSLEEFLESEIEGWF